MSKVLTVNLGKSKLIVIGGIATDGLSESDVCPCGVSGLGLELYPSLVGDTLQSKTLVFLSSLIACVFAVLHAADRECCIC